MTSARSLAGLVFVLAVSFTVLPQGFAAAPPPPVSADQPPPPAQQAMPTDQLPPPPAAVFVRTLDEEGHGAVAVQPAPQSIGPTIDSVLKVMRKLGMVTASAAVMLVGAALSGVLLAGLVLLIRRRRERRAAS